jgi:hypothetical protein
MAIRWCCDGWVWVLIGLVGLADCLQPAPTETTRGDDTMNPKPDTYSAKRVFSRTPDRIGPLPRPSAL